MRTLCLVLFAAAFGNAEKAKKQTSTDITVSEDTHGNHKKRSTKDRTEPTTYIDYAMYNVEFCQKQANEWYTRGEWDWQVHKSCRLHSSDSKYNMVWLGKRDPLSLDWEDYTCSLTMQFAQSVEHSKRSLVTYAAAIDSDFKYLNGYMCTIERDGKGDYKLVLNVNSEGEATKLKETSVKKSDINSEDVVIEMEAYSEWKTCYFTTNDVTYSVSATDRTYKKGSVGVITEFAQTNLKKVSCVELGTIAPTYSPVPTHSPTHSPTVAKPSPKPSHAPTPAPSPSPTEVPTTGPTPYPSPVPTPNPTFIPTVGPTPYPSAVPSPVPTSGPTPFPSAVPTPPPTHLPTVGPTPYPSALPTPTPTHLPTQAPTQEPTFAPTMLPSDQPTEFPTVSPSELPTPKPSPAPSHAPTQLPTYTPTVLPSPAPSATPSEEPTPVPTTGPSPFPSPVPTELPTAKPTALPTAQPTRQPTELPTPVPTVGPTPFPSAVPTEAPTYKPTKEPTPTPSHYPSKSPTPTPTIEPTSAPTSLPTPDPTTPPPTEMPTVRPTHNPIPAPTHTPTQAPSARPTHAPTPQPSATPSQEPTISPAPTQVPTGPSEAPTQPPTFDGVVGSRDGVGNEPRENTAASGFGTADIGLTVMGVVLIVACCVCCLAGIGFNSKRKKRERENGMAWDRVSDSLVGSTEGARESSESNGTTVSVDDLNEPLNPVVRDGQEETFFESLWPTALFGAAPAALVPASDSEEPEADIDMGYQAAPVVAAPDSDNGSDYSADGASMWPGAGAAAKKKGEKDEKGTEMYESMWPGTEPEGSAGKKERDYGGAAEEDSAAVAVADASWTMGDTAMIAEAQVEGFEGQSMAPVVAEEDDEEFHF